MQTNLVGEMTVLNFKEGSKQAILGKPGVDAPGGTGIDDFDLIQAVASALKLSTAEEREGTEKALFPALLCAAAATGSVARMEGESSFFCNQKLHGFDQLLSFLHCPLSKQCHS